MASTLVPFEKVGAILLLILGLLWNIIIWMTPVWMPFLPDWAIQMVNLLLNPVCHRTPELSWWWNGAPILVCIRCSAIYLAFSLGNLTGFLNLKIRPTFRWVWISFGILLLDFGLNLTGLKPVSELFRALTGGVFGFITGWWLLINLLNSDRKKHVQ
ncbi:MAG: DUF2085 domain-containing protein [Bacteroidetes bacterium]|nr:DUF2085 domain-containing protein [Bacteroidota bacterium]